MRVMHHASRAAVPLVAALFAVGLATAPAWASTSARPGPPQPPPWVRADQCRHDGGHLVRDRHDGNRWHCQGGRWNGHDARF
jgi:hypothetical protein